MVLNNVCPTSDKALSLDCWESFGSISIENNYDSRL